MAANPFNSIGGYTVGIPAVQVINNSGVVVGNVNANQVVAHSIYTDDLNYSNGHSYVPGSNTQLVFNNANAFGASANLTFNSNTNFLEVTNLSVPGTTNLGDVSQVSILGGENGYLLQTDGLGSLTWVAAGGGGGGNGNPGGANTQVQYNNAGAFGGDPGFVYNDITNTLIVGNIHSNFTGNLTGYASNALLANVVTQNAQPNITSLGTLTELSVSGIVDALAFQGDAGNLSNIPGPNIVGSIPLAEHVSNFSQPNITSVGTLVSLTVAGNISTANISTSNRATMGNLIVTGNASFGGNVSINTGNLISNGNVDFNGATVELGEVDSVKIFGGFTGQVLTTDGTGNLSWVDNGGGGGGNAHPGGSNTQVQFNNNGLFGGTPYFTYNSATQTVQIGGNLIANTIQMGSGGYHWSTSEVYFATTASMSSRQSLYSIPVSQISGVEFEIIATDAIDSSRQSCKISSLYYNGVVQFTEYASLFVNGGVGNFEVDFDPGDIVTPPSLVLLVTPSTNNTITYKMLITRYAP